MSDESLFNIINLPDVQVQIRANNSIINSVREVYNCSESLGSSLINIGKNLISLSINLCSALGKLGTDSLFLTVYNTYFVNLYNAAVHELNNGLSSINQLFDFLNIPMNTNLVEKAFYDNETLVDNIETIQSFLKSVVDLSENFSNIALDGNMSTVYAATVPIVEIMEKLGIDWDAKKWKNEVKNLTPENLEFMRTLMNIIWSMAKSGLKFLGLLSSVLIDYPISEISLQSLIMYSTVPSDIKQRSLLLSTEGDGLKTVEMKLQKIMSQMRSELEFFIKSYDTVISEDKKASEATKKAWKESLGDLNIFYENFFKKGQLKTIIMRFIIPDF